MKVENAILVSIGDELLLGQVQDTNAFWLAQALQEMQIPVIFKCTIGDDDSAITNILHQFQCAKTLILFTGGLGPTADDKTKFALAKYFDRRLVTQETVLAHVKRLVAQKGLDFDPLDAAQADVLEGSTVMFNRLGTAPGMLIETETHTVAVLPGVPQEMKSIFGEELKPRLATHANPIVHKHLLFFGKAERQMAQDISVIEQALPAYIHLAYLPDHQALRLRLSGSGIDLHSLKKEMETYQQLIADRLSDFLVNTSTDNLQETMVKLAKEHRLSIATAESCTGGLIASKITEVVGASEVFMGSVIAYDNKVKKSLLGVSADLLAQYGAVSEAVVLAMAKGVRQSLNVDFSVAVSGILGRGGATADKPIGLVFFAVSGPAGEIVHQQIFYQDRLGNKEMVANMAINLLRKAILSWSYTL